MSGEPRSRRVKKKKREDDESSHGVHITKMGTDDVHLHVHEDHGTGGHWCAKIIFFALMAILLSLMGLILLENRGESNIDTPLSESRFSNYFDGWVEEHRVDDHHDAVKKSIDEHDEHDEPFEEEEDHSEVEEDDEGHEDHEDDEEADELHDAHDEEEDDEEEDNADEDVTEESKAKQTREEEDDDDDDGDGDVENNHNDAEDDDNDNEEANNDEDDDDNLTKEVDEDGNISENAYDNDNDDEVEDDDDEKTVEIDDDNDDDEDADENADNSPDLAKNTDDDNDDNEDEDEENNTREQAGSKAADEEDNDAETNGQDDEDDEDEDEDEATEPILTRSAQQATAANMKKNSKADDNDNDDPFDEDDDDDGTFESLENVVDNDAEEMKLLQEKARQQAPPKVVEDDGADEEDAAKMAPSWGSSIAVKICVGVALALVSRFVLIRKNPNTNDEPDAETLMKRRLTIANEEVAYPEDNEEAPPLSEDELGEEEEIEYIEEEEEIEIEVEVEVDENGDEIKQPPLSTEHYIPETFEELNAMYRPKSFDPDNSFIEPQKPITPSINRIEKFQAEKYGRQIQTTPLSMGTAKATQSPQNTTPKQTPAVLTTATTPPQPPPRLVESKMKPTTSRYSPLAMAAATTAANVAAAAALSQSLREATEATERKYARELIQSSPPPAETAGTTREVTHDVDYQPDDEDIDYEDDDDYGEEEIVEEEEEEIEDILDEDLDDVSDVDDSELMSRLEAKYGVLQPTKEYESDEDPDDPTWTQIKPKTTAGGGPQAHEDEIDDSFERELRRANEEMMRERYSTALHYFTMLSHKYPDRPAAFLGKAKCLDHLSEQQRSNRLLEDALEAYKRYLALSDDISDVQEFRLIAEHCIERMRFMGYQNQAIPIHQQLITRFPNQPTLRNQLAVTYLMMNRLADAKHILQETLQRWPKNGFALVHYGFVLKNLNQDYASAVEYLQKGIDTAEEGTQDGRFYLNLGEAYQRLGLHEKALKIYERGTALKLFPSKYQRSLYNEKNLRSKPYWTKEETSYAEHLNQLERNWRIIRDEGLNLLSQRGYFEDEAENLRDFGEWKQFELYARGQRHHSNCLKAPITCSIIKDFSAATACRRGQVKFSVMHAGTHVFAHCGPTNCRLRAHLGLVVPKGTRLRVADKERSWTEGKFLIFDDSFEHEVWHEGTSLRLVLIVDFWHPDLSWQQRQSLTPI